MGWRNGRAPDGRLQENRSHRQGKGRQGREFGLREAIDAILQDAPPHDVLTLCVHSLAEIAPICCEMHHDEFVAELLRALGDCVANRVEHEETEAGENDEVHPSQVH